MRVACARGASLCVRLIAAPGGMTAREGTGLECAALPTTTARPQVCCPPSLLGPHSQASMRPTSTILKWQLLVLMVVSFVLVLVEMNCASSIGKIRRNSDYWFLWPSQIPSWDKSVSKSGSFKTHNIKVRPRFRYKLKEDSILPAEESSGRQWDNDIQISCKDWHKSQGLWCSGLVGDVPNSLVNIFSILLKF